MRMCRKCHAAIEEDMLFCPECGVKYIIHDTQVYTVENCPIAVVEQNLITSKDGTNIVILLANIVNEAVNAISIRLKCYDQLEDELPDIVIKYTHLSIENNDFLVVDKKVRPDIGEICSFRIIIEKILLEKTGHIKNAFSNFTISDDMDYLREKINIQNAEIIAQTKKAKCEEEIVKKSLNALYICDHLRNLQRYISEVKPSTKGKTYKYLDDKFKKYSDEHIRIVNQITELIISAVSPVEIAFHDSTSLQSIRFLKGAGRSNLKMDFSNCTSLETVILPEGLTEISSKAFEGCKSLKNINIPNTVIKIDGRAFANCESLEQIYLPDSVTHVATDAFENCHAQIVREKDVRIEQYWLAHAKEKQQLEEELVSLNTQLNKVTSMNMRLSQIKGELATPFAPSEQEYQKVQKELSTLRTRMNSLGIFKGKEKKEIQTQINELQTKLSSLENTIKQEKETRKNEINAEITQIEEELKHFNDKTTLQKRIAEINDELTKPR